MAVQSAAAEIACPAAACAAWSVLMMYARLSAAQKTADSFAGSSSPNASQAGVPRSGPESSSAPVCLRWRLMKSWTGHHATCRLSVLSWLKLIW